jgi:hypothetical protein
MRETVGGGEGLNIVMGRDNGSQTRFGGPTERRKIEAGESDVLGRVGVKII